MGVGVYQEPAWALWIQSYRCVTAGLAVDKLKLPCSHIRVMALRMNRTVQTVPSAQDCLGLTLAVPSKEPEQKGHSARGQDLWEKPQGSFVLRRLEYQMPRC